MRDARGQHPRLAGACACQHQHRPVQGLDRLALFGVEPGEILRCNSGARARGNAAGRGLVVGDAGMGQSVRLGHTNRLTPNDGTAGP